MQQPRGLCLLENRSSLIHTRAAIAVSPPCGPMTYPGARRHGTPLGIVPMTDMTYLSHKIELGGSNMSHPWPGCSHTIKRIIPSDALRPPSKHARTVQANPCGRAGRTIHDRPITTRLRSKVRQPDRHRSIASCNGPDLPTSQFRSTISIRRSNHSPTHLPRSPSMALKPGTQSRMYHKTRWPWHCRRCLQRWGVTRRPSLW